MTFQLALLGMLLYWREFLHLFSKSSADFFLVSVCILCDIFI